MDKLGTGDFVPWQEVVLFSEVTNVLLLWEGDTTCPLFRGCPLFSGFILEVPLYLGGCGGFILEVPLRGCGLLRDVDVTWGCGSGINGCGYPV